MTGWPHLEVEAYDQAVRQYRANRTSPPLKRVRFDRLGEDVLLCLFEGEIKTVNIHEHPEVIHFGVETGPAPTDIKGYQENVSR